MINTAMQPRSTLSQVNHPSPRHKGQENPDLQQFHVHFRYLLDWPLRKHMATLITEISFLPGYKIRSQTARAHFLLGYPSPIFCGNISSSHQLSCQLACKEGNRQYKGKASRDEEAGPWRKWSQLLTGMLPASRSRVETQHSQRTA